MFGLGYGGRKGFLYPRLGLLVLVVLAAVAFHGQGKTYDAIHDVYLAAIVALIGFALFTRSSARRRRQGGGPGGPMGPGGPRGPGAFGSAPQGPPVPGYGPPPSWSPPASQPVAAATSGSAPPPAGWYADPWLPGQQRYWDGRGWGPSRHLEDGDWVDGG